jgi:hypothetical protein
MRSTAVTSEAPSRLGPQFWKSTQGSSGVSTRMRSHTVMRSLACCRVMAATPMLVYGRARRASASTSVAV